MSTAGQELTKTEKSAAIPTSVIESYLEAFLERGIVLGFSPKRAWQGRRTWTITLKGGKVVHWEVGRVWSFIQGAQLMDKSQA